MSPQTTRFDLPYPQDSDSPNGPAQIGALALLLDQILPGFGVKAASGADMDLSGAYVDVPGASQAITPAVPSKGIVLAIFDFLIEQVISSGLQGGVTNLALSAEEVGAKLAGTLNVDGADQSKPARLGAGNRTYWEMQGANVNGGGLGMNAVIENRVQVRATVFQLYQVTLSAAAHTLKLRAKIETATGGPDVAKCIISGTQFGYLILPQETP
jgi:hypothetical protein